MLLYAHTGLLAVRLGIELTHSQGVGWSATDNLTPSNEGFSRGVKRALCGVKGSDSLFSRGVKRTVQLIDSTSLQLAIRA